MSYQVLETAFSNIFFSGILSGKNKYQLCHIVTLPENYYKVPQMASTAKYGTTAVKSIKLGSIQNYLLILYEMRQPVVPIAQGWTASMAANKILTKVL